MRSTTYTKGQLILTEGHRGAEAFIVEHGRVQGFRQGPPELPLAILGPGQIVGEMALLTDQPRSASVRAVDEVQVAVVGRDAFLDQLRGDPQALLPFLRTLTERIRNMTTLLEELARRSSSVRDAARVHLGADAPLTNGAGKRSRVPAVHIEGITAEARDALRGESVVVGPFPYRIGRLTRLDDPFAANELGIPDVGPWWISRDRCMLTSADGRRFLVDRGSRLGTMVDARMIGGGQHVGHVELRAGAHEVRIGGALTPYRFSMN